MVITMCVSAIFVLTSCGGKNKKIESNGKETKTAMSNNPLNISVYLDLSDRLTRQLTPSQMERDIEIVNYLSEIVKKHAIGQNILPSKDKMKIFFYPSPNDSKISLLSKDLEMDLSVCKPEEKKKVLKTFQSKFNNSLTQIYKSTLSNKNWIGSDIWGFFKKQVDAYCIKEGFRNIIVILTDGYIYYEPNKQQQGNAYSYILPQTLKEYDAKLIVSRQGLENLEVLLLEVNPYDPKHQETMENILTDWFHGMGIKKIYVGETDQPSNTKLMIDKFMQN